MRDPDRATGRPIAIGDHDADGITRRGLAFIDDVARKDPGMPARGAIGRFAIYSDSDQVPVYLRRKAYRRK